MSLSLTHEEKDRFWRRVIVAGKCWLWTGCVNNKGYGLMRVCRRAVLVHRLVFEMATGEAPGEMEVCHQCDTPRCVNPAHLWLGTHADNMADRDAKGRVSHGEDHYLRRDPARHPLRARPELAARGEGHGRALLNDDIVRELRRRRADGETLHSLAACFGVDRSTVTRAIDGRSWRHVQ